MSGGRYMHDPSPLRDFSVNEGLKSLVDSARKGDTDAAQQICKTLAEDLRSDSLTELQAELLASILDEIAKGRDAREATMTAPPSHRPPRILRDREIFIQVQSYLMNCDIEGRAVVMMDVYAGVGRTFTDRDGKALSAKTVKNIYLRELQLFRRKA